MNVIDSIRHGNNLGFVLSYVIEAIYKYNSFLLVSLFFVSYDL